MKVLNEKLEQELKKLKPIFVSKSDQIIDKKTIDSPLGKLIACANQKGICFLDFADKESIDELINNLEKSFDAHVKNGGNPHFETLENQLSEYFLGKRTQFTVPIEFSGTDFQKKVWQALCQVPFGKTISYQEQSDILENPKAIRAVANANGKNKILILVPCHRVIGSNGKLTGYSGGIARKEQLLELEQLVNTK